jgi:Fur family ferric uptake transcriptional regulator
MASKPLKIPISMANVKSVQNKTTSKINENPLILAVILDETQETIKSRFMQPPCGRKRSSPPPASKNSLPKPEWREILNEYLKKLGLRATSQREKVAEIAIAQSTHFEIQSLIRDVRAKYPEISPATVYRSVNTLCEAGILNETLQTDTGVALYEAHDDEHHDHIVCVDCGEIFEFHDEGMEESQVRAIRKLNFEQSRHKHVIYAKCTLLKR